MGWIIYAFWIYKITKSLCWKMVYLVQCQRSPHWIWITTYWNGWPTQRFYQSWTIWLTIHQAFYLFRVSSLFKFKLYSHSMFYECIINKFLFIDFFSYEMDVSHLYWNWLIIDSFDRYTHNINRWFIEDVFFGSDDRIYIWVDLLLLAFHFHWCCCHSPWCCYASLFQGP